MKNKIKQFRVKHNLSQRKLAELLKVNPRTVQKWEAGDRTPHAMTIALLDKLDHSIQNSTEVKNNP